MRFNRRKNLDFQGLIYLGVVLLSLLIPAQPGLSQEATPPSNDNFASAIDLGSSTTISITGNNFNATLETGEITLMDPDIGPISAASVWYKWTAPESGQFTVKAGYPSTGVYMNSVVAVGTGNSVSTLTQLALGIDSARAGFTAVAGVTYYIAVQGHWGNEGDFFLKINQSPTNDNFANAIDLGTSTEVSISGSNTGAALETGELNPLHPTYNTSFGGASVWYKWTPSVSGRFSIKTTPGYPFSEGIYPVAVISTGASVSTLTQVGLEFSAEAASFGASAGTTYYIAIHGSYGQEGTFLMNIGLTPANDNFADAIDLGSTAAVSVSGSNTNATMETGETMPTDPVYGYDIGGESVWWKWKAPASGRYFVKAISDNSISYVSPTIVVSTGATVSSQIQLGVGQSQPTAFSATSGSTYYIAVHGAYGTEGYFQLSLGQSPANDNFSDAIDLGNAAHLKVSGTNLGATSETGEPLYWYGGSVWWNWTAPSSGAVTICTLGSDFDSLLGVYTGDNVDTLAEVAFNDDAELPTDTPYAYTSSLVTFNATAGTTYRICVGQYSESDGDSTGSIQLQLSTAPANDNRDNAANLGSDQTVTANTLGATSEPGEGGNPEGDGQKSLWWKYTENVGGRLEVIDTLGSDFDTVIEIYTETAPGTWTLIRRSDEAGADHHSRVAFPVTSGSTYSIRVFGYQGDFGNLQLNTKSYAPATTAAGHILWARALLETLDGDGGVAAADTHLAQALTLEPSNGEANLLRAFTTLALLQQQTEFTQLLTNIGASKTSAGGLLRSKFSIQKDSMGVPITTPGSTTSLIFQYLQNQVPTLDNIDTMLGRISSTTFLAEFTDSETGSRYVKVDGCDVQILRAALKAAKAVSYFSQTYDLVVSLDTVAHQSKHQKFNPEELKSSYTKLLKFAQSDRRNDFRDTLRQANSWYQAGSESALSRTDPTDANFLFRAGKNASFRTTAANLTTALDGSMLWEGNRVDLSKIITSGSSLRDFLMNFHERSVIANTTPDPLFGGALPDSSQATVNDFFRKRGFLFDVSTYTQWAAQFLPGTSPEDQTAEANPTHDGINNRTKYAFGLNPLEHCERSEYIVEDLVKNSADSQKYLTVTFVRRIDDASLQYIIAVSDDLKTWDRTHTQIEQVGTAVRNSDGITETVTFRLKSPASIIKRKFLRIEVNFPRQVM